MHPIQVKFKSSLINQCIEHETKRGATRYNLYGMSHHSGTLYGGHYIG
jgi:ubiquitin C-terminal hydrolase